MPADPSEGIPDGGDQQGFIVLNRFLQAYLTERDIPRAMEIFSDQIYGAGTGESETAVGKEAFSRLLKSAFVSAASQRAR